MCKRSLCLMALFFAVLLVGAQPKSVPCDYAEEDSLFVVRALRSKSVSTLDFARKFLGRPYVAHTLEKFNRERVIVNTRQLDCTTLVESAVALTLCKRRGLRTMDDYVSVLCELRYRWGKLDGYTSRLHYFSDWIDNKSLMHIVTEIQAPDPPFTEVQTIEVNYMSTHPNSYKALRKHPDWVGEIARQEQQLTGRSYRYIPKSQVANHELLRQVVRDGDIIAITTSKPGLDIAHLGFAVWHDDGQLHLLNASQLYKRVIDDPVPLCQYLQQHPSHTGIRIVRLFAPLM